MPRKSLLLALFTLGNLLALAGAGIRYAGCRTAADWPRSRRLFSIGSTIATGLVPKEKTASVIAVMFGGLIVARVTGVSLRTFIGQYFSWRETFMAVSLLGVIAFISSLIRVPGNIPQRAAATIREQL